MDFYCSDAAAKQNFAIRTAQLEAGERQAPQRYTLFLSIYKKFLVERLAFNQIIYCLRSLNLIQ